MNFSIPPSSAKVYFLVSLTLLVAVIVDSILRSLIKVPKSLDSRRARTYVTLLRNIVTIIVYGVALHIIFIELGVSLAPLLASSAILGIIVGIGARPIVEDLIAGFSLLSQSAITIGDYVKIDDAEGYIESMSFRTVTLRADTGALYIIPNSLVKKVANLSRHKTKVFLDLPVKSDQKIDSALKAAREALSQLEKDEEVGDALYSGSTVDGIESFQPMGPMIIRVTLVTYPVMRLKVGRKYRLLAKKAFEDHKISLG